MLVRSDQPPPRGRVMLKKITSFDAFACLVMIAAIFYLAAITHILPLPESALTRLSRFSISVVDVLYALRLLGAQTLRLKIFHYIGIGFPPGRGCSVYQCPPARTGRVVVWLHWHG